MSRMSDSELRELLISINNTLPMPDALRNRVKSALATFISSPPIPGIHSLWRDRARSTVVHVTAADQHNVFYHPVGYGPTSATAVCGTVNWQDCFEFLCDIPKQDWVLGDDPTVRCHTWHDDHNIDWWVNGGGHQSRPLGAWLKDWRPAPRYPKPGDLFRRGGVRYQVVAVDEQQDLITLCSNGQPGICYFLTSAQVGAGPGRGLG